MCYILYVMYGYVATASTRVNVMPVDTTPTPGQLLAKLRERRKLSLRGASKQIGISHTRVSDIENSPGQLGLTLATMEGFSRAYDVPLKVISDIALGKITSLNEINSEVTADKFAHAVPVSTSGRPKRRIPCYDGVEAGPGAEDGIIAGYASLDEDEPGDVCYNIRGNSMEPDIPHGSNVIVDTTATIRLGDFVVAYIPDIGMVCKKLVKNGHNERVLASVNLDYTEFNELVAKNAQIIGKVVKVEKRFS